MGLTGAIKKKRKEIQNPFPIFHSLFTVVMLLFVLRSVKWALPQPWPEAPSRGGGLEDGSFWVFLKFLKNVYLF